MPLSAILLALVAPLAQTPTQSVPVQNNPAEPVAESSAVPTAEELHAFAESDTRMTLPVRIGDSGPYDFIVDTGSERSVISRELANALGLLPGRNVRISAIASRATAATVIIPSIAVGSLGGVGIEAPALDQQNIGAPGLLGLDTLQDRALTIDFDRREMSVASAIKGKKIKDKGHDDDIVIQAKSVFGQLVLTDAFYRGHRVRVVLDTGSSVSVGNLAFRKLVAPGNLSPVSLLSVTGARLVANYTFVPEILVASIAFKNLPMAFADAPVFTRLGLVKRPAMLLGMDALRMFRRVQIDFANRRISMSLPRDLNSVGRAPRS